MKRFLIALACSVFSYISIAATPAGAIDNKTFKLNSGHTVQVDVCDEGIFRVRISPRKEFEESLMERYGCIKTDWAAVKTTESNKGSEWTVSTKEYSLTVNKKTGVISLKDAKGNSVIREIRLLDNGDKLC